MHLEKYYTIRSNYQIISFPFRADRARNKLEKELEEERKAKRVLEEEAEKLQERFRNLEMVRIIRLFERVFTVFSSGLEMFLSCFRNA